MNNKRIDQLAFMLSYITKIQPENAREIIVCTETGKAILTNNMTVMYEQQTENLAEIAAEIAKKEQYRHYASMLTTDNIVEAAKELRQYEREQRNKKCKVKYTATKNAELKNALKKQAIEKRKAVIGIRKQNKMNIRGINHVN